MGAPKFNTAKNNTCICKYCNQSFKATRPDTEICYDERCHRARANERARLVREKKLKEAIDMHLADKGKTLKSLSAFDGWFTATDARIPLIVLRHLAREGLLDCSRISRESNVCFRVKVKNV
jgi:hypothetical protein